MAKLAVIQKPPVLLDKLRTIHSAVALVEEAASEGAKLILLLILPGLDKIVY